MNNCIFFEENIILDFENKILNLFRTDNYSNFIKITQNETKFFLLKNLLNNEPYVNILIYLNHYSKNMNNNILITNKEEKLIELLLYIDNMIDTKIQEVIKSNFNDKFLYLETKLINMFFDKYFTAFFTDNKIEDNIYLVLHQIFFNIFDDSSNMLLYYKNSLNNDFFSYDELLKIYCNKIFNIFEKLNINIHEINKLNIKDFSKNIQKYIYFYYSVVKIKYHNTKPELLIDNLYVFKNRFNNLLINNIDYINYAISNIIYKLRKNNFVFQYESPYFTKFNINNESEDFFLDNKDNTCSICYEDIDISKKVIPGLLPLIDPPSESIGKFRKHDLSIFDQEDLDYVKKLGFDIK
jgi:hypothetical protein